VTDGREPSLTLGIVRCGVVDVGVNVERCASHTRSDLIWWSLPVSDQSGTASPVDIDVSLIDTNPGQKPAL
jgi:hypothetical protein